MSVVDATDAFDRSHVEGILTTQVARVGRFNSPWATSSSCFFSRAQTCASVRISSVPATWRSNADKRFLKDSSHAAARLIGHLKENEDAAFAKLIGNPQLTKGGLLNAIGSLRWHHYHPS